MILPIEDQAQEMVYNFVEWYGVPDAQVYPIGGEVFGVWEINDEFWGFQDIITALKSDITPESLSEWYRKTNAHAQALRPRINLKSWIMGARYGKTD